MDCIVCVEKMTPSRVFTCPFCEYKCCKKCVSQYLLHTQDDPNCMNCRKRFDRDILAQLPKTFINNALKNHRENTLLDQQKSMMPSTQIYVNQEITRRQNQQVINQLNAQRNVLKRKLHEINRNIIIVQRQLVPPFEAYFGVQHNLAYHRTEYLPSFFAYSLFLTYNHTNEDCVLCH